MYNTSSCTYWQSSCLFLFKGFFQLCHYPDISSLFKSTAAKKQLWKHILIQTWEGSHWCGLQHVCRTSSNNGQLSIFRKSFLMKDSLSKDMTFNTIEIIVMTGKGWLVILQGTYGGIKDQPLLIWGQRNMKNKIWGSFPGHSTGEKKKSLSYYGSCIYNQE